MKNLKKNIATGSQFRSQPWLPVDQWPFQVEITSRAREMRISSRTGPVADEGAGVRCIRDKKERGSCTVSGARTPFQGGETDPLSFCFRPHENRKRGETTKYPLNSFLDVR